MQLLCAKYHKITRLFVLLGLLMVLPIEAAKGVKSANMQKIPNKNLRVYINALDKITANTDLLILRPNKPVAWKGLQLMVRTCYKAEAFEAEETTVFIELDDVSHAKPQFIFSGWMFASSPAISAIDHPLYDISLQKCVVEKPDETQ